MDKTLRDKWIAALRSGEYKQNKEGIKMAYSDGSYCAVGVLIDIATKDNCTDLIYNEYTIDGHKYSFLKTENKHGHVAYMNDIEKKSFYKIAQWIEENL